MMVGKKFKNMKMKIFTKTGVFLCVAFSLLLSDCTKADKEFVHDSNTITSLRCRAVDDMTPYHVGRTYDGVIREYDKNENLVPGTFEQKDVEGGYGTVDFLIDKRYENEIDLHKVYLYAILSWDQSITPSLSGTHDITGDGIVITVRSGVGTLRKYRIRGYFE